MIHRYSFSVRAPRYILCMFLALGLLPHAAQAVVIERIVISGNERIPASTVESYLEISPGEDATKRDFNNALKRIFNTGFFADANIEETDGILNVGVLENPSVSEVAFEGNSALEDDALRNEISLRNRSIYTRNKIQNDVARLLDVYQRNGRYSATVEPKVIQLEQNRINVVYEINEGPKTLIESITFIGNEAFGRSTLTQVISSTETAFYKFLSNDDVYDPDRLEFDKELLRRFYRSEGYADFTVKSAFAELSPDQEGFHLTFVMEEGNRYLFNDIALDSGIDGFDIEQLGDNLLTVKGERYDASAVESTIDILIEELGNAGYAFVDVRPRLKRNPNEQTIDLLFEISEGARVYVERINIDGNERTLDEVIRRQFRLVEGDAFSATKLQRSEQRLRNLGYFGNVSVNTLPGSTPDRTQISVEVEEQSTGEVSFGAGFSTVDGPLADFGIRERNLLGKGQDLRLNALLAAERSQFDIGFTEPYFLGRDIAAGFDLFQSSQDLRQESSFDRDAIGGALRASYALGEFLQHSVRFSYEENEITNIDAGASRFILQQEGTRVTSLFGQSFTYDKRDNRFAPTEGSLLRFSQDIAGLGGDDEFLRHEIAGEYYYPLAEQFVLSLGGSAGHILPFGKDDVVINQRFFLGGRRLRGFDNSGVGPRDILTDDALGGNTFFTASAETRFPLGLPDEVGITGAFFLDAGTLFDTDDVGAEVVDEASIRASVGFGLAWSSPFGPIRIDFSLPFLKEDFDETETFQFNFGTRF